MKSKVIIFCVLLFCSEFVASSPFNEDSARQWQDSQNTADNYHDTGFTRTQNINSLTNSAQYANNQEYNGNQGRQIYNSYKLNNQASPQQALPVKEAVNFAPADVQTYPIRTDNNPIRVNNQQYTQQQWHNHNRYANSAASANRGYVSGYNRPMIPARQPPRPFINGPGQPIQYVPNRQHLHYHSIRDHSGSLHRPVRYENYNEHHGIASNINRVPVNNGYGENPPPYTYNDAIPANTSPNNRNEGYREGSVINPGHKYPIQNTYQMPIVPPNLSPDNNRPPQVPFYKYPGANNPAPINDYNGAPILSNPNSSPPMPSIPSDEYDKNPIPIDKTLGSYKNPGESYPDVQPAPANPVPPSGINSYNNLFHQYSTGNNPAPINDYNGAPILSNSNNSPPMPSIPSDEYDKNPIPIDKTLDSYKNPGESYPDVQPVPANPVPSSGTDSYNHLYHEYSTANNPAPINDYNGAPILSNPNSSPPMLPIPPIPSDEYDQNPVPIDKTLDSYKNPGESYPDVQPAPTNPVPPTNSHNNLYHHYSKAVNQGNVNDFLSSSKVQDLLSERKNRYMILHPNGTIEYIDKLDEISNKYPNYIVLNKNNNTSTAEPQSQQSNPPPVGVNAAQNILGTVENDKTDSSPQSAPTPANKSNIPLVPSYYNYQHQHGSRPAPSKGDHPYHPWNKHAHPSKHPTPVFTTTTGPPTPDAETLKEFLDSLPNDTDKNSATTPEVPNDSDYNPSIKLPVPNDNDKNNDKDNDNDKNANKSLNDEPNSPTTTTLSEEDLFMKHFLDSLIDQPSDDEPSNNDNDNNNNPDNEKNSKTTQPWKLHTVISPGIFSKTTPSSIDRERSPYDVTMSPIETNTDQIITISPIELVTDNVRYDMLPNSDEYDGNNDSKSSSKTNTKVNSGKDDTIPCPHKANKQKVDDINDEITRTNDKDKKTTAFNDSLTKTDAPATTDDSSAVTTIASNQNDVNTVDSSTTGDNLSEFQLTDVKLSINIPDDPNGNITISIEVPESTGIEDEMDGGTLILSLNTPESSPKKTTATSSDDDDGTDHGFDKNKSHVIDLLNSVVVCSTTNSTDIMNKMNANNSSCNVMYVIQMAPPSQPRVEKNKETTYFANGTVVEEYTETTWQDENTPITVTMKKVYHRDPVH